MNPPRNLLLAALVAAAAAAVPAIADYSVTVDTTFVSQYYFRGQKLAGPAFQPSVELASGSGAIGIWTSNELSDWGNGTPVDGTEIDFYGSYTFAPADGLGLPVGFTYYYYPKVDEQDVAHSGTFELYVGLNYSLGGLNLSPKIYYDFTLKGFTFEGTAAYSIPLEALGTSIDLSAVGGTWTWDDYDSADTEASVLYYSFGAEIPYKLSDSAKVTAGVYFVDGTDSELKDQAGNKIAAGLGNDFGPGRFIYSLSLTVGF